MAKRIIHIDEYTIPWKCIYSIPKNKELKHFAKQNRRKGNFPEIFFWHNIKNKQFYGIDFNRQFVIGNFIADFYAHSLSLVIEIDGESHNDKQKYDATRDEYFKSLGMKVFRATTYDVLYNIDWVLSELKKFIITNYLSE